MAKLTLSVPAYLKWQMLAQRFEVEVTAYGVPRHGSPLYLDDLYVPEQVGTICTTETKEGAPSEYGLDMLERFNNNTPEGTGCHWLHTHPAISANPSSIDERTFSTGFGKRGWAVMSILSKTGDLYARLRIQSPTLVETVLAVEVDWAGCPDILPDLGKWVQEATAKVQASQWQPPTTQQSPISLRGTDEIWYGGRKFTQMEWNDYTTTEDERANAKHDQARGAMGTKTRDTHPSRPWTKATHPLLGEEVVFEYDAQTICGRVVDLDEDTDILTIRESSTGDEYEVDIDDVELIKDVYGLPPDTPPLSLEDAYDRLGERMDAADEADERFSNLAWDTP